MNELKSKKYLVVAIVFMAFFFFMFHLNANAHSANPPQDGHDTHHASSACSANICCSIISVNDSLLEPIIKLSDIIALPSSLPLKVRKEPPYKPPKLHLSSLNASIRNLFKR